MANNLRIERVREHGARAWALLAALTLALAAALLGGCAEPAEEIVCINVEEATVVRVVDGDTLQVRIDGEKERLRLIGINCPESVAEDDSRNTEEGVDASKFTKSLIQEGQTIWLERDYNDVDQYDRLLRYVWLELPDNPNDPTEVATKMLNGILVVNGYAEARVYGEDRLYADILDELEHQAVEADRGVSYMWA